MRPLLGTFVEIGACKTSPFFESAVSAAFSKIEEVHSLLSFHDPESDLSRLNASPGHPMKLNRISVLTIRLARQMTLVTNGLFNCTLGGRMVDIGKLPNHSPTKAMNAGLPEDIQIRGNHVTLKRPVKLTLDGIAKGLAVDLGVKTLKKMGVRSGWINAGGDLRVFGEVSLPLMRREPDGSFSYLGKFEETAIATSSTGSESDAKFPGMILSDSAATDPRLGCWTVAAKSAWRADALTKVAALAPHNERKHIINKLGGEFIA
jgi:FAD:protein FMN transferase